MAFPADDTLAILKLLADYNHAIDFGDSGAFAATFVDGGSLDSGFDTTAGHDALAAFAAATHEMLPGGRHQLSNISIDGSGDTATARAYLQLWNTAGGSAETALVVSGRYDDELTKADGQWKFVARKLTPDR